MPLRSGNRPRLGGDLGDGDPGSTLDAKKGRANQKREQACEGSVS